MIFDWSIVIVCISLREINCICAFAMGNNHQLNFFKIWIYSIKAEQPLQDMELQEKETQKD